MESNVTNIRRLKVSPSLPILMLLSTCALLCPHNVFGQMHRYVVLYNSVGTVDSLINCAVNASSFLSDGSLGWSATEPRTICPQNDSGKSPGAVSDGTGGMYVVYTVERRDEGKPADFDIYISRFDSTGHPLWGDPAGDRVAVAHSSYAERNPKIVLLSDTSLLVFYEVHYGIQSQSDVDIAAVRINGANGKMMWNNGVWILKTKRREELAAAIPDGRGGAIAVVESTTRSDKTVLTSDILAMRCDSSGAVGWPGLPPGPVPVASSKHIERNAAVIGDGDGGLFAAYEIEYTSGDRTGDADILAQHISAKGVRQWMNTAAPPVVSSDSKAREGRPSISVIDKTGIIVAFEVSIIVNKKPMSLIGVQRIDSSGSAVWNKGLKPKLISASNHLATKPMVVTDRLNNIFVVTEAFDSKNTNTDIYCQSLDKRTGTLLWGENDDRFIPVLASPDSEHDPEAIPDEAGGLYVIATSLSRSVETPGVSWIIAQRLGIDGAFPWAALGVSPLTLTRLKKNDSLSKTLMVY